METSDRQIFITAFQNKFKDSFESISEKYDEQLDFWTYRIQFKEGIDKNDFLNTHFQYIVDSTDFEDAFDLWFNQYGDDIETEASILSVNAEFNDDDEFDEARDAEANELEAADFEYIFSIEIEGTTYNVQNNKNGVAPAEYSVFSDDDEYIGSIYPEYDDAGNVNWASREDIDSEVIQQIAGRISQENDESTTSS